MARQASGPLAVVQGDEHGATDGHHDLVREQFWELPIQDTFDLVQQALQNPVPDSQLATGVRTTGGSVLCPMFKG